MFFHYLDLFVKIFITILLCSLIGYERELRQKGAGLRTHILVGVGSALIVLTSFHLSDIYQSTIPVDPSRMISAIVTGIGFLCAGTIIRGGNQVTGLTTAATLWISSSLGMAVGCGLYDVAIIFAFSSYFVLVGVRVFETKIKKNIT